MIKRRKKTPEKLIQEKEESLKMKLFFFYIWTGWNKYSELSEKWVGNEFSTLYFHHILPKSQYSELKFCVENIICLTADEHHAVEAQSDKYPEINKRKKYLLDNYEEYSKKALIFEEETLNVLVTKSKDIL